MEAEYSGAAAGKFFHGGLTEMEHMSETPKRGSHRRAHSDMAAFRLPDDLLFDEVDASDFGLAAIDLPSFSDTNSGEDLSGPGLYPSSLMDTGKSLDSAAAKAEPAYLPQPSHLRSLSMDAAFLESLSFTPAGGVMERGHRRTGSLDGQLLPLSSELDSSSIDTKKAMPPEKLAELQLLDPKRAKRKGNVG